MFFAPLGHSLASETGFRKLRCASLYSLYFRFVSSNLRIFFTSKFAFEIKKLVSTLTRTFDEQRSRASHSHLRHQRAARARAQLDSRTAGGARVAADTPTSLSDRRKFIKTTNKQFVGNLRLGFRRANRTRATNASKRTVRANCAQFALKFDSL